MDRNLKQALRNGEVCVGSWLALANEGIAEILCDAGYRWLAIDLEHSATSLRETERLIRVIDAHGVTPLVRVSSHDTVQMKRVMDAGAHGLIVPMVNERADVTLAAESMHYPPAGHRGVGLGRAQGYGERFDAYRGWLAESAVLIPQIEHVDALNHLDGIVGHPAVDAVFVGPYDLTASMGLPGQFTSSVYLEALAKIRAVADQHNVPAGIHVVEPDPSALRATVADGYRFIAYSVDFRMVADSAKKGLAALDGE